MAALIGLPILVFAVILQSVILSQIQLLLASADLVLVLVISWIIHERVKAIWEWALIAGILVGFVSELPMWLFLFGYLAVAAVGALLKRRVWRVPLIALFTTVFIGTLIIHSLTFIYLRIVGTVIDPTETFNLILLPSLLLNLLMAIPAQGLINEFAGWFYPDTLEG